MERPKDVVPEPTKLPIKYRSPPASAFKDLSTAKKTLHNDTQALLETELFVWGKFPIVLPNSRFSDLPSDNPVSLESLFKSPNTSELRVIAKREDGKLKKLDEAQLDEMRRTGKFRVPSVEYPGRYHEITLSKVLQEGKDVTRQDLKQNIAYCLEHVLVYIPNRVKSSHFSMRMGCKEISSSLWHFLDLLVGMRSMVSRYSEGRIEVEVRKKYAEFILKSLKRKEVYVYVNEGGEEIDFKVWELLFKNKEVANRLKDLYNEVDKKWSREKVQFRQDFIQQHKNEGLSESELTKLLEDETINKANQRLLEAVEKDEKLDWFHPLLPSFAVNYFKLFLIVENMHHQKQMEINNKTEEVTNRLKRDYPIRSLIPSWLAHYVSKEVSQYMEATEKRRPPLMHQLLQKAKEEKIQYFPYFMQKQIDFRDEQISIENGLRAQQEPSNTFPIYAKIWKPKNWIIESSKSSKGEVTYSAKTWDEFDVSSSHLGWRLKSLGIRSWCWFKNGFYYTFIVAFLHGPLSLRALFTPQAYFPSKRVNRQTGKLETDTTNKVETLLSRLASIWSHVSKSVYDFEKLPDEGILGKNISRIFNRFWNYVVKGLGGSALLVVFFPVMCVISVAVSFVLSLYAPVWAPLISVLQWLWSVLIYDFEYSYHLYPRTFPLFQVLFKFGILGIGQIAACLLLIFFHPQFALLIGALAVAKHSLRYLYDFSLYHVILKRLARVPAVDNFLARRTAGPGLRGEWFFQIETDIALLALQLYLESIEVNEYRSRIQKKVTESSQKFVTLEKEIFQTFGLSFDSGHQSKVSVESRNTEILKELEDKIYYYKQKNAVTSNNNYPRNIKQTSLALSRTIEAGTKIVEDFYKQNIFYYMSQEEINLFWSEKNLADDDWVGLTKNHFNTIFPGDREPFTVPVDENNDFSLKVQHLNLSRFAKMIYDSKPRDDLDHLTANLLLKTNNVPKLPQLSLDASPLQGLSFLPYYINWYKQIKKQKE